MHVVYLVCVCLDLLFVSPSCSVLPASSKPLTLWSAVNHGGTFYRLFAYLFLFNRFQDQQLASDIKQLLLDGRNAAVAMAIVLSPLLSPFDLSSLFYCIFSWVCVPYCLPSFSCSFLLFLCSFCCHYVSPPRTCTSTCSQTHWASTGHRHLK